MKLLSITLATLTLLMTINARADHREDRDRCTSSVRKLEKYVRYSSLRWDVKRSVNRFVSDYYNAQECLLGDYRRRRDDRRFPDFPRRHDVREVVTETFEKGHDEDCRYAIDRLARSFSEVDRYLYDTSYDHPRVFYTYTKVKRQLDDLLY